MLQRKSFSNQNLTALKALFGVEYDFEREAIVDIPIDQNAEGRVWFRDTSWIARCSSPIALKPGEQVYVVGIQNITLIVEPIRNSTTR